MKPYLFGMILIALINIVINTNDYDYSLSKFSFNINLIQEYEDLLANNEICYLVLYYNNNESDHTSKVINLFNSIQSRIQYLVKIITINCDKSSEIKDYFSKGCLSSSSYSSFPKISMLISKKDKDVNNSINYTEIYFNLRSINSLSLYEFIIDNIQDFTYRINRDNFDVFLSNKDLNKMIVFTNHMNTPFYLRGISCYYYDRLLIGKVNFEDLSLLDKYNISSFPSILLVIDNDLTGSKLKSTVHIETYFKSNDEFLSIVDSVAYKDKLSTTKYNIENNIEPYYKVKGLNKITSKIQFDIYLKAFRDFFIYVIISYNEIDHSINTELESFISETNGFNIFLYINCSNDENTMSLLYFSYKSCLDFRDNDFAIYYTPPLKRDLEFIDNNNKYNVGPRFDRYFINLSETLYSNKNKLYQSLLNTILVYSINQASIGFIKEENYKTLINSSYLNKKSSLIYFSEEDNSESVRLIIFKF